MTVNGSPERAYASECVTRRRARKVRGREIKSKSSTDRGLVFRESLAITRYIYIGISANVTLVYDARVPADPGKKPLTNPARFISADFEPRL